MSHQPVHSPNLPKPVGPYSPGMGFEKLIFVSGQGGTDPLTGTIAEQVQQLLTEQINPSLASHGGFAELKGVEDTVVYVTMGGGCQGCAVSAMTLRDGIARSIREAIPEVTDVVDTTDHEAGENPFYS